MKLIQFIFLISVLEYLGCATIKPAKVASQQHPEAVACDPQYDANQILAQKILVPAEVFHFTQKKTLVQDINEHRLTKKSWDTSLTGGDRGMENRQARRGLYVSDGIDTSSSASSVFGAKNNWLVKFSVADECRVPQRVATLLGLEKDKRFITWFNKINSEVRLGFQDAADFSKTCNARESLAIDGYTDLRCEKIVLKFFDETKIAIVQDHQTSKSFYIRDFSCIESLAGTPEEMIQVFVSQDFWVASCSVEYLSEYTPYLLATGLSETKVPLSKADYELLFQNVGLLRSEVVRTEMAKMLKGYWQCLENGKRKNFQKDVLALSLKLSEGDSFRWVSQECSGE